MQLDSLWKSFCCTSGFNEGQFKFPHHVQMNCRFFQSSHLCLFQILFFFWTIIKYRYLQFANFTLLHFENVDICPFQSWHIQLAHCVVCLFWARCCVGAGNGTEWDTVSTLEELYPVRWVPWGKRRFQQPRNKLLWEHTVIYTEGASLPLFHFKRRKS